ncbi:hypothetical protein CAC42_3578 [Sphaceloma murrayae]|uniref:Fucose-specific lectin n=1 Tax=Sphaceloma murrayae TaxID=2082308 RepID=A0A2K1QTC4_9PEZI|nr:hypothetical protein CAC42_3578 [Sphaceloma murrayae]
MTERHSDGPEVLYVSNLPEVAIDRSDKHGPIVWSSRELDDFPEVSPFHRPAPVDYGPDEKHTNVGVRNTPWYRRSCSIPRRTLIILGVLLIISLGIGLGLGLTLPERNATAAGQSGNPGAAVDTNANSAKSVRVYPTPVLLRTGLASVVRGDGAGVLVYYQAANGSLIEDFYANERVSLAGLSRGSLGNTTRIVVDAPDIRNESPLGAVSYSQGEKTWRHLFYIDTRGFVRGMNSSTLGSAWSTTSIISSEVVLADLPSLSTCHSPLSSIGLRLFYTAANDSIIELYKSPSSSAQWSSQRPVLNAASSPMACTAGNTNSSSAVLNVFARNSTGTNPLHLTQTLPSLSNWTVVTDEPLPASQIMALDNASSIAAATNANSSTSYVFYRGADGNLKRLKTSPTLAEHVKEFRSGEVALLPGSRIAAAWPSSMEDGPVVFYQTRAGELRVSVFGDEGAVLGNVTVV